MTTSETRAVLVGIVVVALVGLAALARWHRNRHLNARDDEREVLLLRQADLDSTGLGTADADGTPNRVVAGAQTLSLDPAGLDQPREDQLDDAWADELAYMNSEHARQEDLAWLAALQPRSDETRVMEEGWFDAWEADQAAWAQAWRDAGDDTDMWLAHGMAGVEGEWPPYTMAAQIHTERMVTA